MDLPLFKAVKPKSGSRVKGPTTEMDLPVIKAVPAQNKVCDKGEEPPAQVKPVFRAVNKVLSPEMDIAGFKAVKLESSSSPITKTDLPVFKAVASPTNRSQGEDGSGLATVYKVPPAPLRHTENII